MSKSSMNISLPTPLLTFARERAEKDDYGNTSAYIRALIIQDKKRAAHEKLNRLLTEGFDDLKNGNYTKISTEQEHESFFDNIINKAKSRNK